ncbi:MAG: metallopeptidase TldD-related protein [bacterium]
MKKGLFVLFLLALTSPLFAQRMSEKTIETIGRAMNDELARSKNQLKLKGLVDPFFVSYVVSDNERLDIIASFGAITRSQQTHQRQLNLRLMVNNYQLNDENFDGGGGGLFGGGPQIDMSLPLDNDYNTIRRAFWLATDDLFKDANETFTKKKAALERKQLTDEDRDLPDFSQAPKVELSEAPAEIPVDRTKLEALVRDLSAVFIKYKPIENSNVAFSFSNIYQFLKNTEGTNVRKPQTICQLEIQATAQAADDGEPLSLATTITVLSPDRLPSRKELLEKAEKLAQDLTDLTTAPKLDGKEYSGPVLFEGEAGSEFISEQIIAKLSAQREDVLGGGSVFSLLGKAPTFQKKIGVRVLPASITVEDRTKSASAPAKSSQTLGCYSVDEEGVVPNDMTLVENGILKTLYMTRTPTKEVREPNGHSRQLISGGAAPGPGVVEITDKKAMKAADMKKDLFKRAKEDGYDFAFIIRSTQKGTMLFSEGMGNVGDILEGGKSLSPVLIYKVSIKDGKETLIRGAEVSLPTSRDLREIITCRDVVTKDMGLAAGSGSGFSVYSSKAPATLKASEKILVPELEVRKKKTSANPIKPVVEKP